MIGSRVDDRTNAAGPIGLFLRGLLDPTWIDQIIKLPYAEQISEVYKPMFNGQRVSELQRTAAAFLVPDFPVQTLLSEGGIMTLVSNVIPDPPTLGSSQAVRWANSIAQTVKLFPLKKNPAAANKVNVYLNEILGDLKRESPMQFIAAASALYHFRNRLFNDQAGAVVLYGAGLISSGVPDAFWVAANLVADPALAKAFTTVLKAVGANGSRLGAMLVEANTLRGRDVDPCDLKAEALYRTTTAVNDKLAVFPEEDLRQACRAIFSEEIAHGPEGLLVQYPTLEDHWDSRWGWAVNGAHSGHVSKEYARAPKPAGMLREHRRAWLESVSDDPRPTWDGHTYVSVSPKLESGKTRAIFACDTVSYLAFEHLLAPVERRWRHKNIILDPGKGGHVGMTFKTRAARDRAGVSMMLDYDDFNSQHSNRSMQILFEELCDITGYPSHLKDTLINSFDKCDIYLGAQRIGRALGTLMSGHRGTTFINSVLNRVYLVLVLGADIVDDSTTLHVGDDVYMGVRTYQRAGLICQKLASSCLRMNPIKQSVGHTTTEFLRNATSGRDTRGYFARGVAGIIAGNWANETKLSPSEALTSMLASCRTLINRSGVERLPLLLFTGLVRLTGLPREDHKKLRDLMLGVTALDNGPLFHHGGYYRSVRLHTGVTASDQHGYTPLPNSATASFLSRAAQPLEVTVLTQAGVSLVDTMQEASFKKSLPARYRSYETVRLGALCLTTAVGSADVADLVNTPPPRGVLQKYPLLTLARNRLDESLVRWAVKQAGGNPNAVDLEMEAWGEYKHGCIIASALSYSDAAMYGHRTVSSVLTCPINVYV
ncbi:RNA dependent RNA polymerase [Penicillium aurantiogriseum totivirus 1]|uniref:RNA dependent RNA polymerase n=1 Tax=Penicillium aurantiogriseum totivirus 1 TaxID=1755467 RepID=UPI00071F3764|nr:RNA dependent RNA polymerase [Penicillium aurantiogriseum totivirus 1]ALN98256.1 RNA dependent RNA polymerase [Penicillium aurantiogriseum totivirus 1]